MQKKITFTIEIDFSDSIYSDLDIAEIADNVAVAIVDGANGLGIAPLASDAYTEQVKVLKNNKLIAVRKT